jgi:hypothetical protein
LKIPRRKVRCSPVLSNVTVQYADKRRGSRGFRFCVKKRFNLLGLSLDELKELLDEESTDMSNGGTVRMTIAGGSLRKRTEISSC